MSNPQPLLDPERQCQHEEGDRPCGGIQVIDLRCIAHLSPEQRATVLTQLRDGRACDFLQGVTVSQDLLQKILNAARDNNGQCTLRKLNAKQVTFQGAADFRNVRFEGLADFRGAEFAGTAWFSGAEFAHTADFGGAEFTGAAWFGGAEFAGTAEFGGAGFAGAAWFGQAKFADTAGFGQAKFADTAGFGQAEFAGTAWFGGAGFAGAAWFGQAEFADTAGFGQAEFAGTAWFGGAEFAGTAGFGQAKFADTAWFGQAKFAGTADFGEVEFAGTASFNRAQFDKSAEFSRVRFATRSTWHEVVVDDELALDGAVFEQRVEMRLAAAMMSAVGTRWLHGARIELAHTDVVLDRASFAAPSMLLFSPTPDDEPNGVEHPEALIQKLKAWSAKRPGCEDGRPRLISVQGADLANVTVSGCSLALCRFAGAHNLDRLRIEASPIMSPAPAGHGRTRRLTLFEEGRWRHVHGSARQRASWRPSTDEPSQALAWRVVDASWPDAGQVSELYRALRKGREDAKDEPGAADFYYGEMEMRRAAAGERVHRILANRRARPWLGTAAAAGTEYLLLWLYWAISGYGLRAWRALAVLTGLVLVASFAFASWGFLPPADPKHPAREANAHSSYSYRWDDGIRLACQSVASLLHVPAHVVSPVGQWIELMLRYSGPILLGLAALALRARVKR
ncbi:MAG: pentapeptide repeat-containing protein [Mycobacteriales bacterium]